MSDKDLESLCCVLNLMPARVVASLNETDIWWLPDLKGTKKRQAIVSIRLALRAFESPDNRVFCIAWLYCCLAQRGRLRPWLPYIADATGTAWKGKFVLHERLAEALQSAGFHTTCAKVEILNRIYACVMARSLESDQDEYDVICLCVMPPLPQIFVHATRNASAVVTILQSLLRGDPCQMANDVIGEMRFAFATDAQDERETIMRNASSASDELRLLSKTIDPGDGAVEPGQHCTEEIIVDGVFAVPVTSPPNPDGSSPSSGGVARFIDLRDADCSSYHSGKAEEELNVESVEFRGLSPEKTARKY